jgi:nucleoside-diphosphate-sugar epimerase
MSEISLPPRIDDELQLENVLSRPSRADVQFVRRLDDDIAVVGAGGKMGPSLARRIRRAMDEAECRGQVCAIARFSSPTLRRDLDADGIRTLACDLLDPEQVARLPDFANVLFLAGMKFGSSARPDLTWALNTIVPANVARRFSTSRIVAFSTGNVYPFVEPSSGGCAETDSPDPVGEYAQSCLGRERIFEHYSSTRGTPCLLFRLFYATDLRYGVLADIARKVHSGETIDLSMAYLNTIWQGDANSYALRSLDLSVSPARPLNVTGPDTISVRSVADFFGRRFSREPRFSGSEGRQALLGRTELCGSLLGKPEVPLEQLLEWTASWVDRGGTSLGKPTHYERTDGRF